MISITQKYELLTKLPLLQGLSGKELAHIESLIGMEVDEMPPMNKPLIRQGDPCTHLLFLTTGTMLRQYRSKEGVFQTKSFIQAPTLLEPQNLYGLDCRFRYSYTPQNDVSVISISKSDLMQHLMRTEIFRINYLNMLSAIIHKKEMQMLPLPNPTVNRKIAFFLRKLFADCYGRAEIMIKMTDLANFIGETRLNTSRALNELEDAHLLELKRSLIIIHDIKTLQQI